MKLTKYEHSCVVLEKDGQSLVVDPGIFSPSFVVPKNVAGIVVTHEHRDHIDLEKIKNILEAFPETKLYTNKATSEQVPPELVARVVVVQAGDLLSVGSFSLQFVGGKHEVIREDLPIFENVGVIVDETYYHPGDSHFTPEEPYTWLGIPQIAPWSKASETDEFAASVGVKKAIQIHDALLSEAGHMVYDGQLQAICEKHNVELRMLKTKEQIEL